MATMMTNRTTHTTIATTTTMWRLALRAGLGALALGLALAGVGPTHTPATRAASMAVCGARVGAGARIGGCAPTFALTDARGRPVTLTHYRGHPVLINFWGVGCAFCAQELPDLKRFAALFARRGGVILGVNTWGEPRALIAGYARTRGVAWPLLPDQPGTVGALYGVRGTPTNAFVDRAGVIRALTVGPLTLAQLRKNSAGI